MQCEKKHAEKFLVTYDVLLPVETDVFKNISAQKPAHIDGLQ